MHSVIFVACGAAPESQGWVDRIGDPLDGDGCAGDDDSDDGCDDADTGYYKNAIPCDDDVDNGVLEHQVHNMLLRLRIHVDDPRKALAVAEDLMDLIDLREQFRERHQILHTSLGEEEFSTLWDGPFKELFFEDERSYWKQQQEQHSMVRKKHRSNSRFYAWVRRRYGARKMVRSVLRFGLSSRLYQFLKAFTNCW